MKAIGIMRYGGPEVLEIIDVEEVNAGHEEIRIKNFASTVNPTEKTIQYSLVFQGWMLRESLIKLERLFQPI